MRQLPKGMAAYREGGREMTPPKLSVDSAGRVQGANVSHNSPWPCRNGDSGGMSVPSGVMGMLEHTQVGNNSSSVPWFNSSASQASAHFCIAQSGAIVQMGPITGWKAWHAAEGNPHWYGCEFADDGQPANPLTQAQIDAGGQLLELLSRVGHFPLQLTNSTGTEGLGWHGMGGAAYGGHYDCPGDVRKSQRQAMLDVAEAIRRGGGNTPTVGVWVAQGQKSLHDLAAGWPGNETSTVLRLTAERSPSAIYTPAMATYLNSVFAADKAQVPPGVTVFYPKGSGVADFSSHGTQTLQGLADAWHCECSAIVRLTAEHSAGAVFSSGMAQYLNGVFSRSTAHVPAGVHLYYES